MPDDPHSEIRKQIRQRRLALGMTQDQAAVALGVSRLVYHRIETGPRKLQLEDIAALCEVYQLAPETLLGDLAPAFHSVRQRIAVENAAAAAEQKVEP